MSPAPSTPAPQLRQGVSFGPRFPRINMNAVPPALATPPIASASQRRLDDGSWRRRWCGRGDGFDGRGGFACRDLFLRFGFGLFRLGVALLLEPDKLPIEAGQVGVPIAG